MGPTCPRSPSPECLQGSRGLQGTPVVRHQPVSETAWNAFDSRHLHHSLTPLPIGRFARSCWDGRASMRKVLARKARSISRARLRRASFRVRLPPPPPALDSREGSTTRNRWTPAPDLKRDALAREKLHLPVAGRSARLAANESPLPDCSSSAPFAFGPGGYGSVVKVNPPERISKLDLSKPRTRK